jgi:hypothetical protein
MALVEHVRADEHTAILYNSEAFDNIQRKEDLLEEGVAAVFGVRGSSAELLALSFKAGRFSPGEAEQWLLDRRLPVLAFNEATGNGPDCGPVLIAFS